MKKKQNFRTRILFLFLVSCTCTLLTQCKNPPFEKKGIVKVVTIDSLTQDTLSGVITYLTSANTDGAEISPDTTDSSRSSFIIKMKQKGEHAFTLTVAKDGYQFQAKMIVLPCPPDKEDLNKTIRILLKPY